MTWASTLAEHSGPTGGTDGRMDSQSRLQFCLSATHVTFDVYVCVCVLQKIEDFSLVRSDSGEIVTEDGRSRCPFNPEYKSTAIMAGRCQKDSRLSIKWGFVNIFFLDVQKPLWEPLM